MDDRGDEQLVRLFRESGEMRHFDELVERHVGKVRAMIYPMVFNDADADDLTQEVFLRVVSHIDRFRHEARFSTWLYRIALNTTHSFLRSKARNRVDAREELPDHPDGAPQPDHAAAAGETGRALEKAMAGLAPRLRSALVLTVIQGMGVHEAAKVEGCLTATMYWRVHEARRLLRTSMERSNRP